MKTIFCMLFSGPALVCGYIYGYLKIGFIVGLEKAEEHLDA